jgi:hypothetical protein
LRDEDFMDALISINAYWLRITQERNSFDYIQPDYRWLPLLIEHGYVKKETKTLYVLN